MDPTPDLKWKKKKARKFGMTLQPLPTTHLSIIPDMWKDHIGALESIDGWSKSLIGIPLFTATQINYYYEKINKIYSNKSTLVKKNFERGSKLLEEQFVDLDSIYVKNTDSLFFIKGVCAASLKKKDRWITIALSRHNNDVQFAYCQCPAGKTGTCSHSFALMKLVAKWVLEKKNEVPLVRTKK